MKDKNHVIISVDAEKHFAFTSSLYSQLFLCSFYQLLRLKTSIVSCSPTLMPLLKVTLRRESRPKSRQMLEGLAAPAGELRVPEK